MNKKVLGFFSLALAGIIIFGSCKPKQSAYKSVYESAREREMEDNAQRRPSYNTSTNVPTPAPVYSSSVESVRKEKVTPVYESDASGLKAYNVVIAAMGMKPNADALKQRMENQGYKIILVQNEQGMFRVIIASANTKEEAVARKNEILSAFSVIGDTETLRRTYGIPFNDWWILEREY